MLLIPEVSLLPLYHNVLPWCNSPLTLAAYQKKVRHNPKFLFL